MGLSVGSVGKSIRIRHPVNTVEKLGCFKDHFDDMFVAMSLGGIAGNCRKDKDIHGDDHNPYLKWIRFNT